MAQTRDVVQFEIGNGLYAMDINFVREIIELLPVTPLPGGQSSILGVINLRGEVTTVISINTLLGLTGESGGAHEKIIIMVPESTGGTNLGIVVKEVHRVVQVTDSDIEPVRGILSSGSGSFVKGIIKTERDNKAKSGGPEEEQRLMIYLDIIKILQQLNMPSSS
jgi:purine-binding chemotaxis protein CheW